jgi:hypothetical protein
MITFCIWIGYWLWVAWGCVADKDIRTPKGVCDALSWLVLGFLGTGIWYREILTSIGLLVALALLVAAIVTLCLSYSAWLRGAHGWAAEDVRMTPHQNRLRAYFVMAMTFAPVLPGFVVAGCAVWTTFLHEYL